ncbi:MAG: PrsW family glutamic-type intramembrane protease [bacterium]|nr:PrsW family glutamic-type intramembrane protease [bacterium]
MLIENYLSVFYLLAIPVGIAPTLIWLFYYLRKDLHPEPRHMVLLTFLGGMALAPLALLSEYGAMEVLARLPLAAHLRDITLLFLASAFIEEFLKLSVVLFLVIHSKAFDEAIDGMIYLMIVALGFAAIENVLVLGPLLGESINEAALTVLLRFWGANLLHVLSSGILGYFFVTGLWSRGLILATLFHGFFNGAIVLQSGVGVALLIFLLAGMTLLVSLFLRRLRSLSVLHPLPQVSS